MNKVFLAAITLLSIFTLAACGGGSKVDDATKEKYTSLSEDVILLLNDRNYEDLHTMFNEEMKESLPVSDLIQLNAVMDEAGQFQNIDRSSVEEKDGYYVTVVVGNYSENKRIFTISYDDQDEIAGLYIK